ncbi:MAG: Trm112 family protein [Terracidiphilus sp.]
MVDKPARPTTFDPATLTQLACPTCYGDLRCEISRLLCITCGRSYPLVDGIPVLIVERTERPGGER